MIYAQAPKTAPKTEDEFLVQFFRRRNNLYFVDIGAHDGRSYSNSRPLWERGWSGTLIEPDPDTFKKLLENYPNKDRLKFLNVAICDKAGPVTFYRHTDPDRTGWHTVVPEFAMTWAPGTKIETTVEGVTIESLGLPKVDFLSIDTEGYDADILEHMPKSFRPTLIMCEVDKNGVRERVEKEMAKRNYCFMWGTYLNSAYAAA